MRQRNLPDRTESFAARPDSSPAPDVLSTALRAVRLAGHTVSETEAGPGEEVEQSDSTGVVHLMESGEAQLLVEGARFTQLPGSLQARWTSDPPHRPTR
jgi:hypothetical protein